MSETKYGNYIITELKPKLRAAWEPKINPEETMQILFLDNNIVEGAFYVESNWKLPAFAKKSHGDPHQHDYDEVLAFIGSDPANPHDLHAEAEVHIGDEVHTVTRSCLIFIPKGVQHGPIDFKRMDRPIFHFSCGTTQKYF